MKNLPSQLVFVLRRVEPPVLLIRGVSPPAASHCPPSYQQFLLQLCFSVKDCGPAEPQRRTPARRTHVNIMKIRERSCQKYSTGRQRQQQAWPRTTTQHSLCVGRPPEGAAAPLRASPLLWVLLIITIIIMTAVILPLTVCWRLTYWEVM